MSQSNLNLPFHPYSPNIPHTPLFLHSSPPFTLFPPFPPSKPPISNSWEWSSKGMFWLFNGWEVTWVHQDKERQSLTQNARIMTAWKNKAEMETSIVDMPKEGNRSMCSSQIYFVCFFPAVSDSIILCILRRYTRARIRTWTARKNSGAIYRKLLQDEREVGGWERRRNLDGLSRLSVMSWVQKRKRKEGEHKRPHTFVFC